MGDLFENAARGATSGASGDADYTAADIEVLEGLEPVRRRPGMYVGGTDERALHHLVAEILDNSMDEAVAGHASRIGLQLDIDNIVTVTDNGRGIPVDPHPKFKDKSALEVILTTLHSGGKFGSKAYRTSGGLHGVGVSVVNALSQSLDVEVARDRRLHHQRFERGAPRTPLEDRGAVSNRRGTTVRFQPDPEIFGSLRFRPATLYRMARSKAYLFRGVDIRWQCAPELLSDNDSTPANASLRFPNGLLDYLTDALTDRVCVTKAPFAGQAPLAIQGDADRSGVVEWAVAWPDDGEGFLHSYCNTVPTPMGGSHEAGFRAALTKSLKSYAELIGNRKAGQITAEDVLADAAVMLSVFIPDPQFQGQTKERLATPEAARVVETAIKDRCDLWLSGDTASAAALLERAIERAEDRQRRRQRKETQRKSATRKLRLPGKLADCSRDTSDGTEIFIVEGDSAGGSAKQARDRETQAVLPLRGKILNVASASADKLTQNQELNDLVQALGCGMGKRFDLDALRYDRVIIMTDADVDGAHIAALLMTFFYREAPKLIEAGRLFLAMPPLYRISSGGVTEYARDEAHKEELLATKFKGGKPDISRFKGLGEMPPAQLKTTTMASATRTLGRVELPSSADATEEPVLRDTARLVEDLMGKKPERRFAYIQENARFAENLDV